MKKLEHEGFPWGLQKKMSIELAEITGIKWNSISAKIGNFKSVAGISNPSNASNNTKKIYKEYGHLTVDKLKVLIDEWNG